MQDQTRGDYGGLGLVIQGEDGAVKIVSPMDDTPASRAGLRAGDYITAIDGQSILGQNSNDAVKPMRGAVGTPVALTIARDKTDPFTVKLTREVIALHTVSHHVEGDIGYLRVSGFDEKTGQETTAALKDLKAKIPHLKGVVLDLRNNPGGLVDSSVEVASDFLDGGEVVSQRGRDPRDIQRYNAKPERRPDPRRARGGAGQLRLGLRRRDRRRRPEGPRPRHDRRPDQLRQGLGADGDPAARRRRRGAEADHGQVLHALRRLDPEDRHHAGPRRGPLAGRGAADQRPGGRLLRSLLQERARQPGGPQAHHPLRHRGAAPALRIPPPTRKATRRRRPACAARTR